MALLRCSRKVISISVIGAATLVVLIVLLVVLLPKGSESPTLPRATVEQGQLEGEWLDAETGDGFKFASFRGIPYAQPPIGRLRFKAPRPPAKWDGVKEAKSDGDMCLQEDMFTGDFSGSEDCLHLSVFTPQLPENENELRPVVVFIHGGIWLFGSNRLQDFGPQYLVHQDIVVVTIQYRLNAFGFLSLDTEEIPGNAAIKDMVASVEWVYRNIVNFGGDPNKITIMGQSAGAASAHWLAQLPALQGKIQRAIIMSGSAYHSWAFTDKNLDIAQRLGQKLSKRTSALSLEELTDLFINSSAEDFGRAAAELATIQRSETQPNLPFAPTVERRPVDENGEPQIITRDAESYFINREVRPVPTIMGITNREWTPAFYQEIVGYSDTELRAKFEDLTYLIPKNIVPWNDTQEILHAGTYDDPTLLYPDIMTKVHNEYFGSTNLSCSFFCKALLYSDNAVFQMDTNRWAQYRAQKYPDVPVYLYRFSLTSEVNPITLPGFTAPFAGHGDDLRHVMRLFNTSNQQYLENGIGSVTIRRMTRLFGNFIKYGNPIPQADALLPVAWEPNRSSQSRVTLLDIDEQLTLRHEELPGEHMDFWNDLYAQYRKTGPQAP